MANAKALDKRRKAIRNIRKITRTMELVATAKFSGALTRASATTAYTDRMAKLVADVAKSGLEISHPLLEERSDVRKATMLLLTGNRGLCGAYNSSAQRIGFARYKELLKEVPEVSLEVSGSRGIANAKYRNIEPDVTYTQFDDKPTFAEVEELADRYLEEFILGKIDRLEVVYTKFISFGKQVVVTETLLPLSSLGADEDDPKEKAKAGKSKEGKDKEGKAEAGIAYEFLPSAESILEEVIPTSFKIKVFKCFLDAAVSEQIARMMAMKRATEAAESIIGELTLKYNRARQSQITNEIIEVVSGADAI